MYGKKEIESANISFSPYIVLNQVFLNEVTLAKWSLKLTINAHMYVCTKFHNPLLIVQQWKYF